LITAKLNFNIEELRRALVGVLESESLRRVLSHSLLELAEHQILHQIDHYKEEEDRARRFGHPNAVFEPENKELMP
jgi:hypothetical protein